MFVDQQGSKWSTSSFVKLRPYCKNDSVLILRPLSVTPSGNNCYKGVAMRRRMQGMAKPYEYHLATWCYSNTTNAAALRQDNADPPFERRPHSRSSERKKFRPTIHNKGACTYLPHSFYNLVKPRNSSLDSLGCQGENVSSSPPSYIYHIQNPLQPRFLGFFRMVGRNDKQRQSE